MPLAWGDLHRLALPYRGSERGQLRPLDIVIGLVENQRLSRARSVTDYRIVKELMCGSVITNVHQALCSRETDLMARTRIMFSILILIFPVLSHAEKCWMAGCRDYIGYIYIPDSQIRVKGNEKYLTRYYGATLYRYELDASTRLLREFGLPPVGSIVTLNAPTVLLSKEGMTGSFVQYEIGKSAYIFNDQDKTVSLYQYQFEDNGPVSSVPGNSMQAGATLLILGYVGDSMAGKSRLFALVMVKSD
jgi:hypothetical protein